MLRKSYDSFELDAVDALVSALRGLGVPATINSDAGSESDPTITVGGQLFKAVAKSIITAAVGEEMARRHRQCQLPVVVIASRIASDARQSFRESGVNYFDRRGDLRIVNPPLIIDTVVESAQPIPSSARSSLDNQVSKEVAIACLKAPDLPHGVREVARYIGRAPSAVSNSMAGLRDDGLLTSKGEAIVPDLFQELLLLWRRRAVSLAALPDPQTSSAQRLRLGLDEPEDTPGWALTDTLAAVSWGMPIVARGDYPPDFYVPSESELRAARSILGDATDGADRACTVAVAPVRLACLRRVSHSGETWPVANHIVVALDIAQDRARGLEALEQWQPEGIVRAW